MLNCLLLILVKAPAQAKLSDTVRIVTMLAEGDRYLFKPGEYTADLDSALSFANQATAKCRHIGYQQGLQAALLLTANIHIEAQRYPVAWGLYSEFNGSHPAHFLVMLKHYREQDADTVGAGYDSSIRWRSLLMPLLPAIHGFNHLKDAYYYTSCLYRKSLGSFQAHPAVLAGFKKGKWRPGSDRIILWPPDGAL